MFRVLLTFWRRKPDEICEIAPPDPPEGSEPGPETGKRNDERGQSLVEYVILLVWTCLAMIAVIRGAGDVTKKIWTTANTSLTAANTASH